MTADDRKLHGSHQAPHWPEPIPESIWCPACDNRQGTTGRFSDAANTLLGVRLACGHRVDPPFEPHDRPPAPSLVHHIVQKAYDLWNDLYPLHDGSRHDWRWVVTPEVHKQLREHQWTTPEPDDERYPAGYTGPVRQDPDHGRWLLFGILLDSTIQPMNHNNIELRIRQ